MVLFVLLALLAVQGSKASYLESAPEVETVEVNRVRAKENALSLSLTQQLSLARVTGCQALHGVHAGSLGASKS